MDRRHFLRSAGVLGATAAVPRWLTAAVETAIAPAAHAAPVRVSGVVRSAGQSLAGIAVSDGLATVETAADGTFSLVTASDRPRVWVSVPAGCRIPVSPVGTARFHAPIAPDRHGEASVRFDLEPLPGGGARHAVLVLGDVQTQNRDETGWFHEQTVADLVATRRALGDVETVGIAVGDIMYDDLSLYPEYERGVRSVGAPFFQVVGNHDLDQSEDVDESSTRTFERHFGPRHYSFDRGAVHYVVLDDTFWHGSGYIGYLDAGQLAWLAGDLARIEPGRTVVVCLHIPTLGSQHLRLGEKRPNPAEAVMNRDLLYRLLEPYRVHILSGHMHESEHLFDGNRHEHVVGAVCGTWWSGPICADGTPKGYAVYEVDGEDVRWRYKSTGHEAGHQIRVHPRASDPARRDALIANVWDWDPAWRVRWYEDGASRGEAVRFRGHDPLSVELHTGPDRPARRTWVEPYPTDHLFEVPASAGARAIVVEATDRFGRTYTAATP
ncbi:MAG: calcineurin-like phosphoesterase C-terminal domain-containing protein [Acidobacteriota bacterium]